MFLCLPQGIRLLRGGALAGRAGAENLWRSRVACPLVKGGAWLSAAPCVPGPGAFILMSVVMRQAQQPHFTDEKPGAHAGHDQPAGQRGPMVHTRSA